MNCKDFEDELQKYQENSIDIEGRVIRRVKRDNMQERYFIQLEYEGGDGNVQTYITDYSSIIPSHRAHELYKRTETSSTIAAKIYQAVLPTARFCN